MIVQLAPLAREIAGDVLGSLGESDIADFLLKLLRIKENIRGAAARRAAADTPQGNRHAR